MFEKSEAVRDLRNALVMAMSDGELGPAETAFIESLRQRLQVSQEEFAQVLREVRSHPGKVALPRGSQEAERAIRLMAEVAAADGVLHPAERRALALLARRAGLDESFVDMLSLGGGARDDSSVEPAVSEIYMQFAQWDPSTRRAKIEALAASGPSAAVALLRMLESYRAPDGAADDLELKALLVEQLGRMGDERAVYYLAQQVSIGDIDDEITNAPLRFACAAALGQILNLPFTPDQAGVEAARRWWFGGGLRKYDHLAF